MYVMSSTTSVEWQLVRMRCLPFSFSPNMVRKTVKLMGPLASLIMASSSSFFTFNWPAQPRKNVHISTSDRETHSHTWIYHNAAHPLKPARPSGHLCWWYHLCSGQWLWKPEWKRSTQGFITWWTDEGARACKMCARLLGQQFVHLSCNWRVSLTRCGTNVRGYCARKGLHPKPW